MTTKTHSYCPACGIDLHESDDATAWDVCPECKFPAWQHSCTGKPNPEDWADAHAESAREDAE